MPVVVFTIAFGDDADYDVLQTIADASGGRVRQGDLETIRQLYRITGVPISRCAMANMGKSEAITVETYLDALPADRREVMSRPGAASSSSTICPRSCREMVSWACSATAFRWSAIPKHTTNSR
ncbi:MAG: hypothetical protein R2844_03820 [Caldilineales bacterium]